MKLIEKIRSKKAKIGVVGLGYVGLPLVREFHKAGFSVIGFDIDNNKVNALVSGRSYIRHILPELVETWISSGRFSPTADFSKLPEVDCIIICVPTPVNKNREPDMTHVISTARTIARYLRRGQLVVLESTTYPGTTDEDMKLILEKNGLEAGVDFYLAYSPEREDPGNEDFATSRIPKVVGGCTRKCLHVAKSLYDQVLAKSVPVSSTKVAEATKLLENIYRAVNIALVNELKILFDRMEIDIWEVIEAAKTKPFGFQPFYPGPGLGGHCIPIDPFYLTWKAREYDFSTKFIELAGEINTNMPYYVVSKIIWVLNKLGKTLKGSRVLLLGMAYKRDVDDQRESPSLRVIEILRRDGAKVVYNDPNVPVCKGHRHYPLVDMRSVELNKENLRKADVVLLMTDHSSYDYVFIERHAKCIVDTRNAFARNRINSGKVYKA
jgi:UDP-N-acetyl-D-glucosamine dehydrogenase